MSKTRFIDDSLPFLGLYTLLGVAMIILSGKNAYLIIMGFALIGVSAFHLLIGRLFSKIFNF